MNRTHLYIVVFIAMMAGHIAFAQENAQTTESLLFKAYKYKSNIILDEFFYKWQREFPTISYNELANQSDTIREVFDIYYTFQELFAENRLDSLDVGYFNKQLANTKFLILQDTLIFEIQESNNFYKESWERMVTQDPIFRTTRNIISDFRPVSRLRGFECLYLSPSYFRLFQTFFANNFTRIYDPGFDSANTDYENKVKFLSPYVLIQHKGNLAEPVVYFGKLLTDPRLERIVIYSDFQQAKVYFNIECGYYVARFEKINNEWIIKSCRELMTC